MSSIDNFIPKNFLDISKEIENLIVNNVSISNVSSESAWLRAIIGRAYYAAFLALKEEFLKNIDFSIYIRDDTGDHRRIKERLHTLPTHLINYYNELVNLRDERNKADYFVPPIYEVERVFAEQANLDAEDIIQNVSAIMNNIVP